MNRKLISLLLALALLTLAGCASAAPAATAEPAPTAAAEPTPEPTAAPTPEPTPEPTPAPAAYSDVYSQYLSLFSTLCDEIERRVETHNAVLESQYPDSYYMHSDYLMQSLLPVRPVYPAMGSALADDNLPQATEALQVLFPDAELTMTAPGCYEARYTYVDKTSGEEVNRAGRCLWECDGAAGSFRVRAWLDDALVEFTEFIPQGGSTWLLYTMTDKILLTCPDDELTALAYAHRISEAPLSAFPGDMRLCSLEEDDFFPNRAAAEDWILSDGDAQYILRLEDGELTYKGQVAQDVLDQRGDKVGLVWQAIDPIQLLK